MKEHEGYIEVPYGRIFYRVVGAGKGTPLLTLHGGPGSDHRLMLTLAELGDERPVIFYDQCGCGRSTIDDSYSNLDRLYSMEQLFNEVGIVRERLGLKQIHLYGHSFGTMLAMDYMLTKPDGVKSVIFSSPCLSAPMWKADADRLRKLLPPATRSILTSHENAGTTDSAEYKEAMTEFYHQFVCRLDPWPESLVQVLDGLNLKFYLTLWGPSEFYPTGKLKDYDRTAELGQINVPTLFLCGRYDEATPETTKFYADKVPNSQFVIFEHSAHLAGMEEPELYNRVIRKFLKEIATEQ